MEVETGRDRSGSVTIRLRREEVAVFRALLDRASFVDTPPKMQALVLDFIQTLRERLPEET